MKEKTIVFDFGGVLIDWNPRHMYRKIFDKEEEMEWFLQNICTLDWNAYLDEGLPFEEGVRQLQSQYPEFEEQIKAYHHRWTEMVAGEISGTVEILREVQSKNYRVYGLTNWSAETFPYTINRFSFLGTLDGIVVSGDEKLIKPDPKIFHVLIDRFNVEPEDSIFIDDSIKNIQTARELGFEAIHFTSPENLRTELEKAGIL